LKSCQAKNVVAVFGIEKIVVTDEEDTISFGGVGPNGRVLRSFADRVIDSYRFVTPVSKS
jgi:hypothetical protein